MARVDQLPICPSCGNPLNLVSRVRQLLIFDPCRCVCGEIAPMPGAVATSPHAIAESSE